MASSSCSMVRPTYFGGYGRQTGLYGGIHGVEFAARCPPDVQRNTRIVAVCGIPESDAAPKKDGWFFSDFFLFYQMLSSRSELPNQLWLSSCSPRDLIRKHGRYVHGPATGIGADRRVVMNEEMLPQDEMKAGLRIFKPKDLLDRFLGTLQSEIREAARTKQPVLVLVFGHGDETRGTFMGCGQDGDWTMSRERLASVLLKQVQTTMIITSCFSGGWVMTPNLNEHFAVKPTFNHSFLAAAGNDTQSLSWDISKSIGRQAGGTIFATYLLDSIITACDGTEEQSTRGREENLVGVNNEGQESHTMAALTRKIMDEYEARCGSLWEEHKFSFAVQDDLWADAWGKRTGLPVLNYQQTWESLPEAPLGPIVYPDGAGHFTGSFMSKSPEALYNIVRVKAIRYMKSYPGLDNAGGNTNCHPGFYDLVQGRHLEFDELYRLNGILDYRQSQMGLAEFYCGTLEIGVPENRQADQFDEYGWLDSHHKAKRATPTDRSQAAIDLCAQRSKAAIDVLDRFHTIHSLVFNARIFSSPGPNQGFAYRKPKSYLAARLTESSMPIPQIEKKLEELLQFKLEQARRAAHSPLGVAILSQPEIKTMRGRFSSTMGRLTHRLRSLSPQKRTPGMEGARKG